METMRDANYFLGSHRRNDRRANGRLRRTRSDLGAFEIPGANVLGAALVKSVTIKTQLGGITLTGDQLFPQGAQPPAAQGGFSPMRLLKPYVSIETNVGPPIQSAPWGMPTEDYTTNAIIALAGAALVGFLFCRAVGKIF